MSKLLAAHIEWMEEAYQRAIVPFETRSKLSLRARIPIPAWLGLVRNNCGLRTLTPGWLIGTNNLARVLRRPGTEQLVSERTGASKLLRLGCYRAAAAQVSHVRSLSQRNYLRLTIATLSSSKPYHLQTQLSSIPIQNPLWLRTALNYLVRINRLGLEWRSHEQEVYSEIERQISAIDSLKLSTRQKIRLQNSYNLVAWPRHSDEWLAKRIRRIQKTIKSSQLGEDERSHCLGITHFHLSVTHRKNNRPKQEIAELMKARRLDPGYFGYDFRLHQLLTDKSPKNAEEYFISALRNSCFDFGLVNDYGVYLRERNRQADFKSWAEVAHMLFPAPARAHREFVRHST